MKNKERQPARSRSREGQREATGHARRIRSGTDLSNCPDFDLQHGNEWSGGSPCDFYTLQYKGVKAHLRFEYMWQVRCPQLGIEKMFLNQVPGTLAKEIEAWIDAHIETPITSPPRQATPADEMMLGRGQ